MRSRAGKHVAALRREREENYIDLYSPCVHSWVWGSCWNGGMNGAKCVKCCRCHQPAPRQVETTGYNHTHRFKAWATAKKA